MSSSGMGLVSRASQGRVGHQGPMNPYKKKKKVRKPVPEAGDCLLRKVEVRCSVGSGGVVLEELNQQQQVSQIWVSL